MGSEITIDCLEESQQKVTRMESYHHNQATGKLGEVKSYEVKWERCLGFPSSLGTLLERTMGT